jgi:Ca-activated chloride channel homolog
MMSTQYKKHLLYGLLLLGGGVLLLLAYQQQSYVHFVEAGNQAVAERRFDSQDYTQAHRLWLADQDMLLFNQGVLAYRASNLPHATDAFRQVSEHADNLTLRKQALYNLGIVLLKFQEAQRAAELFKEALRLDPQDKDAKLTLEHLYHVHWRRKEGYQEASGKQQSNLRQDQDGPLQQAPGLGQGQAGQGRSTPPAGI